MSFKYLNIGGGAFCERQDGWANLDCIFPATAYKRKKYYDRIDINHDLMSADPLPIKDSIFEAVYTEHTIEHLSPPAASRLFSEIHRILAPGGIFRISCPSFDWFYGYMVSPSRSPGHLIDHFNTKIPNPTDEQVFLDALCTPMVGVVSDETVRSWLFKLSKKQVKDQLFCLITHEYQSAHPGAHISCWSNLQLSQELQMAGFTAATPQLLPNESAHPIFHKPYIDTTTPEISIRIEAIKP